VQSDLSVLSAESAPQQPEWPDHQHVRMVRDELSNRPPLVRAENVHALRSLLSRIAAGQIHAVQSGDCAEDPAECTPVYVARKIALLDMLAGVLKMTTSKPVLRVGRIAGQFSNPRSSPTERAGGVDLPVYRGHMVNSPEPDPLLRRPDPERLLTGYAAASAAMGYLCWRTSERLPLVEASVWTSHEAVLLDYEIPMLRQDEMGRRLLTSTHWPWIGNRTKQVDALTPPCCHDREPGRLQGGTGYGRGRAGRVV
jgi:3-deoxy-7-phosphoheptulonate synthase